MKILLTGGSGYIGSVTTELLCDDGHEVVVFDNLERGHIEAVDPRARLIVGDLRETAGIREAKDEAEQIGVMRARTAMLDADVVCLVLDASVKTTEQDRALLAETENENRIVLLPPFDHGARVFGKVSACYAK